MAGVLFTQTPETKKIGDYIRPFADADHFSGVVLATQDNKIIFEKAYGLANVEHNVPNKLDTKFGIASINKGFTSVIFLKLIEEGKIELDDKLSKYIPDFPGGDKITLQMIGRHRSGIKHRVMPEKDEAIRFTPAQFVERVKKSELAFEPGTDTLYSSAGYATLARVFEIASGRSFEELLQEYVFTPGDMKNTVDYDSRKIIKNEASCYLLDSKGYTAASQKDYSFLVGAGSVFSTARDVYKFGVGITEGKFGKFAKDNFVREGIYTGNGSTNGFRANIRLDTNKKYGYVLVSNLGSGANDLILNHLRNVLEGKETRPPLVPSPIINKQVKNNLPDYEGRYKLGGQGGGFLIFEDENELFAGPYKLLPLGKDKFYSFWSYAEITFKRDEKGKVNGLEWVGSGGKSEWVKGGKK
jgi:CubicO group peptidase (beta-lactamase class C family)